MTTRTFAFYVLAIALGVILGDLFIRELTANPIHLP
jgi:hypothetical protein